MQNKKHVAHSARPSLSAVKTTATSVRKEEKCNCDSSCKCGCQEGKECTCGCKCGASSCGVNIVNGILVLFGCLMIAGSVLVLSDRIDAAARGDAPRPIFARTGKPVPAPHADKAAQAQRFDDRAFTDFIKKNPQIIIDSVNAHFEKQQRQEAKAAAPRVADKAMIDEIVKAKDNHVLGNPKGSFVMIEFFDYNCGYCKMMNKKMAEAIKKSDNIRWILMDAPIFGEKSEIIAQYAWAAAKQGKFAEYHAALGEAANKDEAALKEIGKKLGLDVEKLSKDANSDAAKAKLAANREYTKKLQLGGVPMFIIDGNIQPGAFQDEQMEEYIKKANEMKKAKKK